jgi:Transglutaminase-like superfamily
MERRLRSCLYSVRIGIIVALLPLACAIGVWFSWESDNAVLRQQAQAITAGLTSASARIMAVNNWVYHNKGFYTDRFFLLPAFGPTPIQVLESGGDCGAKSRLVSAMLRQLGIRSGLVQIFPCRSCVPIHVVVEAEYEGGRMVVDPIWDLDYPSGNGKYLGVAQLAGTSLGREHVTVLQLQHAASDKIERMPASEATFDYARAINWDKYFWTRAIAFGLRAAGYSPEHMLRPYFLEDPKLGLTIILVSVAIVTVIFSLLFGWIFAGFAERRRASHRAALPGELGQLLRQRR